VVQTILGAKRMAGAMIFRPAIRLKSRRNSNEGKAKWHR
jgi:hypothetical protein